jgi:prevent-host-death family protein
MTKTMTTIDAKENFTELLNHVSHSKERVILVRRGKDLVAVVPLEDLLLLETSQDKKDVREAVDALKESKAGSTITIEKLKEDLGIQS